MIRSVLLLVAAAWVLVACSPRNIDALPTSAATNTEAAATNTPPAATEDTTPEATEDVTPEADAGFVEVPPGESPDGAYTLAVTRLTESDDEAGLFLLDASLLNQSGPAITVGDADLAIVDTTGARYEPVAMPENIQPALLGATIATEETLRGFAQFRIPADATLSHLEWCLNGDCEAAIGGIISQIQRAN